jgi:hypothetical protein
VEIERKNLIQILNLFIAVSYISSSILFLSYFELSFAQQHIIENNREDAIKVDYHNDWKDNKYKIISTTNSENNTKPLNKKVDDMLYLSYNHFSLLYMIPDFKENRYESSSPDDTIIPITLYPNMSSLKNTRVYQNMSSLAP